MTQALVLFLNCVTDTQSEADYILAAEAVPPKSLGKTWSYCMPIQRTRYLIFIMN